MRYFKSSVLALILNWFGITALAAEPFQRVIIYPSIDQHGDSLMLSGRLLVPTDKPAKGVILIPHYTITSNAQAPSVQPTGEAQFYQDDYVLVMPDYLGYGITVDSVHPYLAGELTAHNCIDMLFGVQPVLDSLNCGVTVDSVYIVGYSQGGASAVWILKVMEEEFADYFHPIACYAGGGPYDVTATYDDALARKKVFMPVVVPMMCMGMDAAYDLHVDREAFFTPAMMKIYETYVENKQYSTTDLFFKVANHRLSHWMTPMAMDVTQPQTKRMYDAFKRSSLVRYPLNDKVTDREIICPNWVPKAKLYIFHSKKDNVVTVHCAEHLRKCLPEQPNIRFDIGCYGSHTHASAFFFKRVQKMLKK